MAEFKGTKEKWECIFTSDKKRAIRSKGGIVCTLLKPSKYSGQDERYDTELAINRADQKIIASAPELLEALDKAIGFLKQTTEYEVMEKFRLKVKELENAIKKATE